MRPVGPLLAHATALGPCNGRELLATSALVRARRECGDPSSRSTSTRRDTRRRKPPPQYRTRTWVENEESSPNTNTVYQVIIINRISNLVRILIFYGYQIFLEYNGNCLEITAGFEMYPKFVWGSGIRSSWNSEQISSTSAQETANLKKNIKHLRNLC